MTTTEPTEEEIALFAFKVWNFRQGQVVSTMIHLGDRLGLYQQMQGAGPLTAAELAERTGLHERWLLEWLRSQAAAELLASPDGETFELTPVQSEVLANEADSLYFAAGAFGAAPGPEFLDELAEAFTTGKGMPYDAMGTAGAHATERMLGPFTRLRLIPDVIEQIDGLADRLRAGIRVADIGCGSGLALRVLAAEYPQSTFVGIDPSRHATDLARDAAAAEGLDNIEVVVASGETLPDHGQFDFVMTLDCLHDMPRPDLTIDAIGEALNPDGVWLVKEIRCSGSFERDRSNPVLAMMYGGSVLSCMSSALSSPDGLGLGTLGLPPDLLEEMVNERGFSQVTTRDIGDPANLYYEIRR